MFTVDCGVERYRRSAVAILLSPFIESIRKLCENYLNDLEWVMRFCYKGYVAAKGWDADLLATRQCAERTSKPGVANRARSLYSHDRLTQAESTEAPLLSGSLQCLSAVCGYVFTLDGIVLTVEGICDIWRLLLRFYIGRSLTNGGGYICDIWRLLLRVYIGRCCNNGEEYMWHLTIVVTCLYWTELY